MTEEEIDSAIEALINWFRSQDLNPKDAAVVMLKLIAMQLVLQTSDCNLLAGAINNTSTLLAHEIAGYLKGSYRAD